MVSSQKMFFFSVKAQSTLGAEQQCEGQEYNTITGAYGSLKSIVSASPKPVRQKKAMHVLAQLRRRNAFQAVPSSARP